MILLMIFGIVLGVMAWRIADLKERKAKVIHKAMSIRKSEGEIAFTTVHAPAIKALEDAKLLGIDDDVISMAISKHNNECKRRGIPGSI